MDGVHGCEDEGRDDHGDVTHPGQNDRIHQSFPSKTETNDEDISEIVRDNGDEEDRDVQT